MYEAEGDLFQGVERGHVQAGLSLPAGLDGIARAGDQIEVGFVARPDGAGPQMQSLVGAAVAPWIGGEMAGFAERVWSLIHTAGR